ncbi:hypothetical protein ACIQ7D_17880 [Streptomyces sp. NPDC096310]|uniref:hypothetical protein n=1 Tax=Streptomyces sp. NPDC096310 TaxID=3366082 RepID=UPI0037F58A20
MTATLTAAPADEPRRDHPSQEDEALRQVRGGRAPLSTVTRRDVRPVIARQRRW